MTDKAVSALPSLDLVRTWKFYRYFGFEPVGGEPGPDDRWLRLRRGVVEIDFRLTSVDYRQGEHIEHQSLCVDGRLVSPVIATMSPPRFDATCANAERDHLLPRHCT